jgi:hypothetical protein
MSDNSGQPPYPGQEPEPTRPYEQPGQPAQPYGQQPPPPYGQPQQPYGQPQQPGYYVPAPATPKAEGATASLIVGIIAVAGAFLCCVPVFAAPFAWVMGARAKKRADQSGGALGGRGEAQAGMILGIIGTVILVLSVIAFAALIALMMAVPEFSSELFSELESEGTYT